MADGVHLPELVLLPGLDGTGLLFQRLVREIGGRVRMRVVAYPASAPAGFEELAERVSLTLGPEPVVLLGESFSGPIAVMLADRWPERVAGLVLAGTFTRSPLPPFLVRLGTLFEPRHLPDMLIRWALMSGRRDSDLGRLVRGFADHMPKAVMTRRLEAIAAVDVSRELGRVRCPVLVLHGDRDRLVDPGSVLEALHGKPRAAHRLLEAPHMVLQFAAEQAAREIEAFVTSVSPGGEGQGLSIDRDRMSK